MKINNLSGNKSGILELVNKRHFLVNSKEIYMHLVDSEKSNIFAFHGFN